jgi:hypothetical protein
MKAQGRYELMAMKAGDFMGATEVLAELSLGELRIVGRIARALANDSSGKLLGVFKTNVNFWERAAGKRGERKPTKGVGRNAQELFESGRRIIAEIGADDRKTAGESRRRK